MKCMKKLLLVDGNSMLFRTYYATIGQSRRMTTSQGIPTNAVFGFIHLLQKAIAQIEPDAMLVAWDCGKPTFRHERFEAYKGTRKELDEELIVQMPIVREYLDAANITRYEEEGYEADDIIGSMAASAPDMETYILTSDRDLLQLVDDSTRVILMKKGLAELDIVDKPELEKRYGLSPAQITDLKGLMGDASDNIPGVRHIGEKTALKLLHDFQTVEGVYAHLDQIRGKRREYLEEGKESAFLSKELATIYREMKLPFSMEDLALNPDSPQDFYRKYEMRSLLAQEEAQSVQQSWEIETIDRLEFDPDGDIMLAVASLDPFMDQTLYGFVFPHGSTAAWLPVDKALEDPSFVTSRAWTTWDSKDFMHLLDRSGFPPARFSEDLHVASFLLYSQATSIDTLMEALEIVLPETFRDLGMKSKGGSNVERMKPVMAALAGQLAQKKDAVLARLKEEDMDTLYRTIELPLIPVLYEMEKNGIQCDRGRLEQLRAEFQERMDSLAEKIYELAGHPFKIESPKQLGTVLFDELGLKGGRKRSTAADVLEKLRDEHPIAELILEYRKYSKLMTTYITGLVRYIVDGKIHTTFNQTMTQTGRLSSSDPNLQNISVRDEEGRQIRSMFTAPEGHVLLSADYSQIELRMLAHMADEQAMIQAFLEDADIHTRTACQLFNVSAKDVTDQMRRVAKTVNFGIIYGQTDFGLSQTLGITRREAKEFMNIYFASYPNIHRYTNRVIEFCEEHGYVETLMHRRRMIPEIKDKNFMTREFGKRAAMNAPVQGSAADLIKMAMIAVKRRMQEEGVKSRLLLQIHDELILDVPDDEVEQMKKLVQDAMDHAMDLNVPLKAGIHTGRTWDEAK